MAHTIRFRPDQLDQAKEAAWRRRISFNSWVQMAVDAYLEQPENKGDEKS